MSNSTEYLKAAQDFRNNPGQLAAYESTDHCVVLAGPGSGKTKTLTVKMARMLAEDVHEPRGIACITYNNECVRELETRLADLGIRPSSRVFIGTVHSFSLTQIVIPYEKSARMNLPINFKVASTRQQTEAMRRAFDRVIGGSTSQAAKWRLPMDRYRRSILDRTSSVWRDTDSKMASLVLTYEAELRRVGLIDFDDMPLLAHRALVDHDWVRKAILAKYPILVVDEYQDLGIALHQMVIQLCFRAGIRLFAVGDADQSIYGFTGADPELLRQLSIRLDVETIKLPFNYRCGSQIAFASEFALGEERGYRVPRDAAAGTIFFHPFTGDYQTHATHLFEKLLPDVLNRIPDLTLGNIAILYPDVNIGNKIASIAETLGVDHVRIDRNAMYPRYSLLMRWLELCAIWSCGGWQNGQPRFSKIVTDAVRLFAEVLVSEDLKVDFQRTLIQFLWSHRNIDIRLDSWIQEIKKVLLDEYLHVSVRLLNEAEILDLFLQKLEPGETLENMTLGRFATRGRGTDQISLCTLHSAKGREFRVVFLFGIDHGVVPRFDANHASKTESRRLFYVGFTRAEEELHIVYSRDKPSQFVNEVERRLNETSRNALI